MSIHHIGNIYLNWRETLHDEYVPNKLFFREKQFETLMDAVKNSFARKNVYCEGEKSTGKTVTALKFRKEVSNATVLYMNCKRALYQIFKGVVEKEVGHMSWEERREPEEVLFKRCKKNIYLILDDIQNVTRLKTFNGFLHSLWETALKHKKNYTLFAIGTLKYPIFSRFLQADVRSRYQFNFLLFPQYNVHELNTILSQRLELAGIPYEPGALSFISAKTTWLGSDLRLSLEIMRRACVILETEKLDLITEKIIKKAWEKTKNIYWYEQLKYMNIHKYLLIFSATKVVLAQRPRSTTFQTVHIFNQYRKLCKIQKIDPIYRERLSYMLNQLVDDDWFSKLKNKALGRYGRTGVFNYEMNAETIFQAIKTIETQKERELQNI